VAVVGGGNIAQHHLRVLKELPGVEVVAMADTNPQVLRESAERFSVPQRWPSHRHLLERERPDAVFVVVSVGSVAAVAASFIREGIPTFLEKPPGLYAAHTRRLAELAGQRRTLAMVGVNRRFYSSLLRGRELLLESGPVRSLAIEAHEDLSRVRGNPRWPAEVIRRWSAANGIHALDLLRFFDGEVAQVQALHQTVEGPGPDCCAALIHFAQGAVGRALMDHFSPGGHRSRCAASARPSPLSRALPPPSSSAAGQGPCASNRTNWTSGTNRGSSARTRLFWRVCAATRPCHSPPAAWRTPPGPWN
jgi:predicted dehydrogenase